MKPAPVFGILEAALRLLHFVAATLAAPLERWQAGALLNCRC
ncbi:MAG: hypothetical protein AAFY26_22355 [Cyanobacteria bacterium J06638_22]